jgi:diguanylate cyclase (GGDEF)-like protein
MEIQETTDNIGLQDIFIDLLNSLSAVRDLSELNCQTSSEKELIKNALTVLIQNQDMERCSFFLLNEHHQLVNLAGLSIAELVCESQKDYKPLQFMIGEGVIGMAAQTGELQNCQNCREDERFTSDVQHNNSLLPGSIISVPIFAGDNELIGVLNISHPEAYYFTEWHIRMLGIYKNMLGQLITNYRLFQKMEEQISKRTIKLEQALIDLQALKEHYESVSMLDQLTGLYNRHYFYDQVELAIANTKRYGQVLCLLILDLDKFKVVNDLYGHGFGDEVLRKVSISLQQAVRESDILVRFGGEEFIVIFTNTNCRNGNIFAERIRKDIESLPWEKEGFVQTMSIGLYCLNNECCAEDDTSVITVDNLIHYADKALYQAKAQGRNKVVSFTKDMLEK